MDEPSKTKPEAEKPRKKRGYGPLAAVLVMVFTYVFSQLFAGLLIGFGAGLFGYDSAKVLDDISNSAVSQFIYVVIVQATTLYIIWLFLKARSISWETIGLGRLPKAGDIGSALLVFAVYFLALLVVTGLVGYLIPGINTEQRQQLGFEDVVLPYELVLVFIALVVLPPIVEEILIRGFLYTGLRAKFTKIWSAIIASVLFGLLHLQLGSGAPPLWIAAIDTTLLSLFLVYLREKTGALWAGMIVHFIKNGLAFLALFVVKWG